MPIILLAWAVLWLVAVCGCSGPSVPCSPVADAGSDQLVPMDTLVILSGHRSYERCYQPKPIDGSTYPADTVDLLRFRWTLEVKPDGSAAEIPASESYKAYFVADVHGEYLANLVVFNQQHGESEPDTVMVFASRFLNHPPVADGGRSQVVTTGSLVTLDGSRSSDPDGDSLTYNWSFKSMPEGSAAELHGATTASPSFVADVEGRYVVRLVISDGRDESEGGTSISAQSVWLLGHNVVDAEYSRSLDRIVMVSTDPDRLHLHDPMVHLQKVVELPYPPTCVSVGPGGLQAAVGHDRYVSLVDLVGGVVTVTMEFSRPVFDVVLAGNGYVYATYRQYVGHTEDHIISLEIASGEETVSTGPVGYLDALKLHPGERYLYFVEDSTDMGTITKFDIGAGTAEYTSQRNTYYDLGGELWISKDGLRIFTRGCSVFRSSEYAGEDMRYNGSLDGLEAVWHLDDSTAADRVAVIPARDTPASLYDQEIRVYQHSTLVLLEVLDLPDLYFTWPPSRTHGRFVFFNRDGDRLFAVVRGNESLGLGDYFGLAVF